MPTTNLLISLSTVKNTDLSKAFWCLLLLGNALVWLPALFVTFPTIGLGHDSQIFTAAIHRALRQGNMPWDPMTKILSAREDIFSYPYFGILYPFYWTLGINAELSATDNLKLDFLSVMFHMIVASFTFALLLKRLGCSIIIAVIFGLFYSYSIHLKMWSAWVWAISGYTWLPLCLLGMFECSVKKNYKLGIICLGFGYGLIGLGSALPLVYALITGGAFLLYCLLYSKTPLFSTYKRYISIALGTLLALLLSASHILPTIYRSSEYLRWYSGGIIVGGLKPPYSGTINPALDFSFDSILSAISPSNWHGGLAHPYLGISVILLFIYFCTKNFKNKSLLPLIAVGAYFLLDSFGDATFIHKITYQLPLISSVRYPVANIFIPILFILILSSLGLQQLINQVRTNKDKAWLLILIISNVAVAFFQYFNNKNLIRTFSGENSWILLVPALIGIFCLIIYKHANPTKLIWIPISLLVAQLPQNTMLFHPKIPKNNSIYNKCTAYKNLFDELQEQRQLLSNDIRLSVNIDDPNFFKKKTNCLKDLKIINSFLQSEALMTGWPVHQIYHSPRTLKEFKLFNNLTRNIKDAKLNTIYQSGVTHILSDTQLKTTIWQEIMKVEELYLYQLKNYHLSGSNVGCLSNNGTITNFTTSKGIRSITPNNGVTEIIQSSCSVENAKNLITLNSEIQSSKMHYEFNLQTPAIFISDQVYSHHWKALINNKTATPILIDNYRLAVVLPAGKINLKLNYSPRDFMLGAWLSMIGLICLLLISVSAIPRSKKAHAQY